MQPQVISLYDYSGEALKPWAAAGYACTAYDLAHQGDEVRDGIRYRHADLHDMATLRAIVRRHHGRVAFVSAFPVCTDLAGSGAAWWADKARRDPAFQTRAARHAKRCAWAAEAMGCSRYYVENPIGALSKLWRPPDARFDPCDYGGYLPKSDTHPSFPRHIPPRDAYRKRTCLWVGRDFELPPKRPVAPRSVHCRRSKGRTTSAYSPQAARLGGRSPRTKAIRSATPRGWALAVFQANSDPEAPASALTAQSPPRGRRGRPSPCARRSSCRR